MNEKSNVTIIGGADGPTSIFVAGKSDRKPLKIRIREYIYKYKHNKAKKNITASAHTLKEVVAYANVKYGLIEIDERQREYQEQYADLKEYLIVKNKPELLDDLKEVSEPDMDDEESIREYIEQVQERSEEIRMIPNNKIPMDFHIYKIEQGKESLEMGIDYMWEDFGISYSGSKKVMKQFRKIAKDLYLYYGVEEQDIRNKTERYKALLAVLSQ